MTEIKVVPGRPIRQSALHTAIAALGFDPQRVKALEMHAKGLEASWGDNTYSSHAIETDPWAPDEESTRFLVVDLERLEQAERKNLHDLVRWYLDRHGKPEQAPF